MLLCPLLLGFQSPVSPSRSSPTLPPMLPSSSCRPPLPLLSSPPLPWVSRFPSPSLRPHPVLPPTCSFSSPLWPPSRATLPPPPSLSWTPPRVSCLRSPQHQHRSPSRCPVVRSAHWGPLCPRCPTLSSDWELVTPLSSCQE